MSGVTNARRRDAIDKTARQLQDAAAKRGNKPPSQSEARERVVRIVKRREARDLENS